MNKLWQISLTQVVPRISSCRLQLLLTSVIWVACCCVPGGRSLATPTVTDSGSQTIVDNGTTRFVVDKSNGRITSLKLGILELLGGGGRVYFDANVNEIGNSGGGDYWGLGATNPASYSFTTGPDFVDVAVTHSATTYMPFDVTTHYVMRDGEQGFHLYNEFEHTAAMSDKNLIQTRMVLRGDPSLFDHHSVTDTRFGIMPTPAELAAGTHVQDATTRLNPGTAYEAETGKDVYTKYDWSLDSENKDVIGFYGDTVGAWIVQPHQETQTGGPTKQHLTVHQTETTPALLGMLTSLHYGTSQPIEFSGDKDRSFGPFYVHLNAGPDHATLRADAKTYADKSVHQSFYDTLNIPGWTQTADRSDVTGLLSLASGADVTGATLILSDNNTDFQFATNGNQYWSKANSDGTFDLSGVSPGTYRLTAYVPGVYGDLVMDDVVIGTGTTEDLGTLNWQPPDHGIDVWQIGTFDRTGEEYFHGANDEYRQYGLWFDYPTEFPNGVNFVIGHSDEATDWNFAHWESSPTDWEIEFESSAIPADKTATLTIATAGHRGGRLIVLVNGTFAEAIAMPHDGSVLSRSGIRGAYSAQEISFDTNLLIDGTNTITLQHITPNLNPANTEGIVYDAMKLEIDFLDGLAGDYNGNGILDAADYSVWRETLGSTTLLNDPTPGIVDTSDYNYWKSNFGATSGSGTSANTNVPEPNTLLLTSSLLGVAIGSLNSKSRSRFRRTTGLSQDC